MSQPANDDYSQHLSDDEASYHEDASDNGTATNKPKQQQQQLTPTTTTISNIKLLILKKEEYDIWAIEMEHYLEYIDNDVWKVIQNGNSKKRISTGKDGVVRILPPVSAAEIHAVEKERKVRTILLMAIPKEHLRRFHGMDDDKEIWEATRTRFRGNANSKNMQKAVLKQHFEAFSISSSEGLEKGYERFQQLLSQLEAHGAEVSTEDANHKFLRSLPPAWLNLAMTMRTKPDVDTLSIDDLYNNLRVFEQKLTSTSKSSASAQNVSFVSHSKSSTNKVKSGHTGAYSTYTPTSSNNIQEREVPTSFADEVIYSFFAKQSEDLDLLHEDLEQIDDVDIEEMDINWQIAMIAIRMKKFYKKTGRRVRIDGNKPVGFDKKKLECFKCHNTSYFAKECPSKGTNNRMKRDSFYQDQGARKKEQNQNCLLTMDDGVVYWGEHIVEEEETNNALMAINSNTEKDSSKNLWKLINSGMSSTSKVGLGYEIKSNNEVLSYEEEMNRSVFKCTEEDYINKPLYSRFTKTNSFKGVPHPLTGDYTPKPQEEIDDSLYVYGKKGPQKPEISDSDDNSTEHSTCQSNGSEGSFGNTSKHSSESESESISVLNEMSTSKSVITNEKVVSESKEVEPSCAKHVKTPRQQMKNQGTSEVKGKNWNKMMERELGEGYSFIKKKCFVCGSLSHLIKDCDYYEKKMAREAEFKKQRFSTTGMIGSQYINSVRPKNFITGRTNVNLLGLEFILVVLMLNTVRSSQPVLPGPQTALVLKDHREIGALLLRPQQVIIGGTLVQTPIVIVDQLLLELSMLKDHPLKNIEDRGIFDSGCSGHMTGNKDHLDDFEECKGGSVTFGEERARAKRNKPMTQTQLRNYMSNFLKNQGTWKLTQLKKLNFEEVKAEFEKLVKQLDTYVPMNFEATKESLKRFGEELQTKTAKKLKFDDEGTQPTEEKDEEDKDNKPTKKTGKRRKQIARKGFHTDLDRDESEGSDEAKEKNDSTSGTNIPINHVLVATKSPSIANYKIIKQGRKGVYQIVRENGSDRVYISFGAMLTDISRDDLTELYRIVMRKHGMNEPEDEFEKVLWEYLKNMFEEPLSTDSIWSLPGQQRIICWRYYDACRVHCLNLESVDVYMLIERKYPLSAEVCKAMLDKKLQGGKPDEDCYKLLKMMEKQAGIRKHKDWLVQEQTALGKDFSNPLMADNLPKIVWLSTHHIWKLKLKTLEAMHFCVAKGLTSPD
ncbi:hypothetical protein Tco_0826752 [Tanacetum coccineum]